MGKEQRDFEKKRKKEKKEEEDGMLFWWLKEWGEGRKENKNKKEKGAEG
jgi:hypothetical protein